MKCHSRTVVRELLEVERPSQQENTVMLKAKAEYIASFCNARMDRSMTHAVDAELILMALEEYKALAKMVNGFQSRSNRSD